MLIAKFSSFGPHVSGGLRPGIWNIRCVANTANECVNDAKSTVADN